MKRTDLIALAARMHMMARGVQEAADSDPEARFGLDLQDSAELIEQIAQAQPVCWGWPASDGVVYDTIVPQEHQRHEGKYTTPLYTLPLED